jgi:flavin reductase (DIM6/NTAB) family NADH-FMN oxidoreductase RutF
MTHKSATAVPPSSDPAEELRRTLRRHAAGVAVVTLPGPVGFTATSFTSVSLEPALVSFYLAGTASSAPAVHARGHFAAHVLGAEHVALARAFARSGTDRFANVDWTAGPCGVPLLPDVPAWAVARITHRQLIGDHLLVVGEIMNTGGRGHGEPLVHHDGTFGTFHALAQ